MFRRVKREQVPNRLSDEAEPNKLGLDDESRPNELDLEAGELDDEEEEEELSAEEQARRAAALQAELQRQAEEFGLTGEAPVALYGPNGEAIAELLDSLADIDDETAEALAEAYWSIPDADRKVARSVVGRQHRGGDFELELQAAERAVTDWHNALDVSGPDADVYAAVAEAASDAVDALVLEDELADIDFDTLYGPWSEVMESDEEEGEGDEAEGTEPATPPAVKAFIERLDAKEAKAAEEGAEDKEFGPNEDLVLALLTKLASLTASQIAELIAAWREQPKDDLRVAHRNLQNLVDEDPKWREQLRLAQEEVFAWMAGRGGDTRRDYSFGAPKSAVDIRRPAGPVVADAVAALVMADILEPEDAETLYAPWADVIGTPELPQFEDEGEGRARVKQSIVCLDMEGVLTPEIWIAVSEKTGIPELRRTTRDEPDYDKLMRGRLALLDQHGLKLSDIQGVIGTLAPLPGAKEFLDELRSFVQVVILSDTFEQFATPLLRHLGWPTLLCHRLVVEDDRIVDYALRIREQKREAVAAFRRMNYHVIAGGDSFNDTAMLAEAQVGILFRAPDAVKAQFPQFPAVETYADLMLLIKKAVA